MSNTVEDKIQELFDATQYSIDPYNKPTFVHEIKQLILSEARSIGVRAIMADGDDRYTAKSEHDLVSLASSSAMNALVDRQIVRLVELTESEEEQRLRLSKITGSKEQ